MPAGCIHTQTLIAHYLAQEYPSVLPSFLAASRIPPPDLTRPPVPDLRTLVEDYISQQLVKDLSDAHIEQDVEKADDGSWRGWTPTDIVKVPLAPEVKLSGIKRSLEGISAMNLLTVGVASVPKRVFDTTSASYRASFEPKIVTTSVDKSLRIIDYRTGEVSQHH
ncbi:uncharacterized protein I303_107355 [Kwoniella dejecticola CBS 10117]|uniref:Uncharacterized protein n=1 Tax=Kwoniella dejecticola CBS 10117 TaxID=1296121 RepID=A0AAJ8MK73_9TREE